MILNERNKKPNISFGLGRKKLTAKLGDTVRVYQTVVYNNDFDLIYNSITKGSKNYFDITADVLGVKEVQAEIYYKLKIKTIKSNIIKLNVIE